MLGGVEDSSKDSKSLLVHSSVEVIDALQVSKSIKRAYQDCMEILKYNKLMISRRAINEPGTPDGSGPVNCSWAKQH